MADKYNKNKNDYPRGSRENPVVMPPSSQAGLQAAITRVGSPVDDKEKGKQKK